MQKRLVATALVAFLILAAISAYILRSTSPPPAATPPPSPSSSPSPTPTLPSPTPPLPASLPPAKTTPSSPISPAATPLGSASPTPAPLSSLRDLLWLEDYPAAETWIRERLAVAAEEERPYLNLLLARVLLAQERYEEAANILADLASCACPALPPEVHILRGRALAALGRDAEAIAAYRTYLSARASLPLAAEAYARMARLYRRQGEETEALASYDRAIRHAPPDRQASLQREKAAYLVDLGRPSEAVTLYSTLLARADLSPGLRARALLERAQVYLGMGRAEEAYADWRAAVEVAVATRAGSRPARVVREAIPYAHQALVLLVAARVDVDDYTRGVVDAEAGAYWPAITALVRYLDTVKPHFGDAHAYLARALAAVGRVDGAIEQWRVLIDTHPECPCWADAWFALARLYRRARQDARARALMRELERHPRATGALLERARLYIADQYLGDGNFAAAMREYANLAYEAQTPQVRNRAALLTAVLSLPQRPDTAIQVIEHALTFPLHPNWSPVLRYWLGRAYLEAGKRARAVEIWRALAGERPLSYYAFRAAERLQEMGERVPPWAPRVEIPKDTPPPWRPATARVAALLARRSFPSDVAEILRRAAAYEVAGMDERAHALYALAITHLADPQALLALGADLQNAGYPNLGIQAALRALDLSDQTLAQASPEHWRLLYPLPARAYIRALAEEYDVDPAMLLALIRQESHFATRATSVANARGLMQLIPDTARYVAQALALSVDSEADFYRPTLNLRLGTYFLAYNLRRFDNNVPAALAAYNAGPGNAAYWLQTFGDDPDRFLELIPVLETRTYLREVLRQWEIYTRLTEMQGK